ncbi:MAG: DUF2442 domain-containing protein [Spirochaetia bacterium]|nr:DUF2442 domain-containing protein [Spirochaetia bacterium]
MFIEITKAEYQSDYKIKLYFSDKKIQIVDFKLFLENSQHPITRKYLDIKTFKDFRVEFGDLVWNDYELCFPVIDLYENVISKKMLSIA